MRGKRKRDRSTQGKKGSEQHKVLSNQPFQNLLKDLGEVDKRKEPVSAISQPEKPMEENDDDIFQNAMRGVVPLKDERRRVVRSPAKKEELIDGIPSQGDKEREYLSSLVKDSAAWDISFSDEYMEGSVPGVGPKTMKKLKRGEFSIQDYIDLHGLKKKDAEVVVNEFIINSYQKGFRCVLIIHGRGLGSVDHQPAIKKEIPVWFRRGILKRIVLAFVSARPCDGGAGALYVLLKRG
jgi:DNA-nicking Smr family endonuclease